VERETLLKAKGKKVGGGCDDDSAAVCSVKCVTAREGGGAQTKEKQNRVRSRVKER
jgi:hypothetical protein